MSIYAAIGRGASSKVMEHFPNLTPAILPSYVLSILPHQLSYWISGYFSIYRTFDCVVDTGSKLKLRGDGRVDVVVSGINPCTAVARLFLIYPLSAPKDREFKLWNEILNLLNSISSRSGELDSIIHNIFVLSQELKALRDDSQKSSRVP
jgi:hypothetical protein